MEIKYNISTFFYKIKSQHDSDFIIEMSQLPIKKYIHQLNKEFKQYQKDRTPAFCLGGDPIDNCTPVPRGEGGRGEFAAGENV